MKNQKDDLSRKDQTRKQDTHLKSGSKQTEASAKSSSNLKDDKKLGTTRDERGSSRDEDRDRGTSHKGW